MTEEIYPINAYANTVLVIVMFLITDFVLYKPIVMLDALSSIVMYVLILDPVTLFKSKVSFTPDTRPKVTLKKVLLIIELFVETILGTTQK